MRKDNKLPDKDPNFIQTVITVFREYGFIMVITFILSYLSMSRDGKEPKIIYRLRDSIIGSIIVLIVGMACNEFGISLGWTYVIAGFVSVYGLDAIKELAKRWAEKRIDRQ